MFHAGPPDTECSNERLVEGGAEVAPPSVGAEHCASDGAVSGASIRKVIILTCNKKNLEVLIGRTVKAATMMYNNKKCARAETMTTFTARPMLMQGPLRCLMHLACS